jgi:hypothetical protein
MVPSSIVFPYPSFFIRTPYEIDESSLYCIRKHIFLKLDLFPSSGEWRGTTYFVISPAPHLKKETVPVSETLCFHIFIIMDDG